MSSNLLLILNVSPYYTTVVEAMILLLAVLANTLSKGTVAAGYMQFIITKTGSLLRGLVPTRQSSAALIARDYNAGNVDPAAGGGISASPWWRRHAASIRLAVPAYLLFVLIIIVTAVAFKSGGGIFAYIDSLLVLTSFLAILGFGQGLVIMTGGLDLSLPWNNAANGILFTLLVHGTNGAAVWAIPLCLAFGSIAGLLNGFGVAILGISPIIVTLAMNGLLQGIALVLTGGSPQGWTAPFLQFFMTGKAFFFTPVVWFLAAFVIATILILTRTTFGRQVYAIGNSPRVAKLSGVAVGRTLCATYAISGFCAALTGILLTGFNGQAFNGMGDPYLLTSIAAVVVGGTLITGGRGHYPGIFGGALALTALSTFLAGTTLPDSAKSIIYGAVVLAAIVALRERAQ
jgi:ribose transport system permease protein